MIIIPLLPFWAADAATPAVVDGFPWGSLALAVFLLLLAVAMAVAEVFVASMGVLALGALTCGALAIVTAFGISTGAGWAFLVLVPVVGLLVAAWGFRRLQGSHLVPKAAITADAGYHQAMDRIGLAIGAIGVLVTDAVPTGRARFTGTRGSDELDVTISGSAGRKGDRVRLLRIEGPAITVTIEPAG
jgi:membrane-bound ClpP family serine protease